MPILIIIGLKGGGMPRHPLKTVVINCHHQVFEQVEKEICQSCLVRPKCLKIEKRSFRFKRIYIKKTCFRFPFIFEKLDRKYDIELYDDQDGIRIFIFFLWGKREDKATRMNIWRTC